MPFSVRSKHVPLPKNCSNHVQSAVLHVNSLAQYGLIQARGWTADSINPRPRLSGEIERLETEGAFLREVLRVKDARMARLQVVTSKRPNHVWHVDLTVVPTSVGF